MLQKEKYKIWKYILYVMLIFIVFTYTIYFESLVSRSVTIITVLAILTEIFFGKKIKKSNLNQKYLQKTNIFIFLTILTSIMLAIGIYFAFQNYFENKHKIVLKGTVKSALGEPLKGAIVMLNISDEINKKVLTNSDGIFKFTLNKSDIKNKEKTCSIIAEWKSLKSIPSEFGISNNLNLEILMPQGKSPIKITYYILQKQAIDFLIRGRISPEWEPILSDNWYIVKNKCFDELLKLLKKFSISEEFLFVDIDSSTGKKESVVLNDQNKIKFFFVGNFFEDFSISLKKDEFDNLFKNNTDWDTIFNTMDLFYENDENSGMKRYLWTDFTKLVNPKTFLFWRYPTGEDVEILTNRKKPAYQTSGYFYYLNRLLLLDYFNYITQNNEFKNFGLIKVFYDFNTPEDCIDTIDFEMRLVLPTMKVLISVVENISNSPIEINNFNVLESNDKNLRFNSNLKNDNSEIVKYDWFPIKFLKPGEKIIITQKLIFSYDEDNSNIKDMILKDSNNIRAKSIILLTNKLLNINKISFPIKNSELGVSDFTIPKNNFLNIINKRANYPDLKKEFLWGTAYDINSIKIDELSYKFRKFNSKNLIIKNGTVSGCCPYIYTYSQKLKEYVNEGTIIYGKKGNPKESYDEKKLSTFDGRILIIEKEDEISYINQVYLKIIDKNNQIRRVYPSDTRIRFNDEHYLILKKGESTLINFEKENFSSNNTYYIVVKGYYILSK